MTLDEQAKALLPCKSACEAAAKVEGYNQALSDAQAQFGLGSHKIELDEVFRRIEKLRTTCGKDEK